MSSKSRAKPAQSRLRRCDAAPHTRLSTKETSSDKVAARPPPLQRSPPEPEKSPRPRLLRAASSVLEQSIALSVLVGTAGT